MQRPTRPLLALLVAFLTAAAALASVPTAVAAADTPVPTVQADGTNDGFGWG